MNAEVIREKVRDGYGKIAQSGGSCCGSSPGCCGPPSIASDELARHIGYSTEELSETERMAGEAGLTEIVLKPRSSYVEGMVDGQDPLYQKLTAHLPAGAKPSDFVTSLEITARKAPANSCCGPTCCH